MARRALELTPDDEDGVRRLMGLLDRHGDRGGALRVYSDCQARLQAEYGVEQAPETRRLARKVQAARKGDSHDTPPLQQPLASLRAPVEASGGPVSHTKPRWPIAAGAGILFVMVIAAVMLFRNPAGAAIPQPSSVAVLPLRVMGEPELESAALGIAEELTTALVLIPGLAVRSVARARESIGDDGDIDRIGRHLHVAYIVDGGLQGGAGRLRVTLRLVRRRSRATPHLPTHGRGSPRDPLSMRSSAACPRGRGRSVETVCGARDRARQLQRLRVRPKGVPALHL